MQQIKLEKYFLTRENLAKVFFFIITNGNLSKFETSRSYGFALILMSLSVIKSDFVYLCLCLSFFFQMLLPIMHHSLKSSGFCLLFTIFLSSIKSDCVVLCTTLYHSCLYFYSVCEKTFLIGYFRPLRAVSNVIFTKIHCF